MSAAAGLAGRRGTAARPRRRSTPRACPPAARARPGRAGPHRRSCTRGRGTRGSGRRGRSARPTSRAARTSAGSRPPGTPLAPPEPRHLPDEQDQRRRVLERRVHADRRLGRAGAARDHAHAGPTGELAVRLRHVRRARLVAARHQAGSASRRARRAARGSSRRARRTRARSRAPRAGRRAACRPRAAHRRCSK